MSDMAGMVREGEVAAGGEQDSASPLGLSPESPSPGTGASAAVGPGTISPGRGRQHSEAAT